MVGPLPDGVDQVLVDEGAGLPVFYACESRDAAMKTVCRLVSEALENVDVRPGQFIIDVKKNG